MKTELIDLSPTRKEIKIEIEPQQVRDVYDRISERYVKAATVPGFRRGHAPRSVVRTRYKSEIRGDVLRELLPDAVSGAIDEHSLAAISEPDVQLDNTEGLDRLGEQPITVKVGVEVLPEVKLGQYKELEVTRRQRPVEEADVERALEGLREASASLQPVEDRPAQPGDTVTVNLHGVFLDQAGQEDIKADEIDIAIGAEGVQQEFTDNLTGVNPDDTRTFEVTYPDDFQTKELAGKRVEYQASVTAVRKKELPEIDDEWARSVGEEFESLEKLRTAIREDLEKRSVAEANQRLRSDVMRKLLEAHEFEVPESLVEQQASQRLQTVVRDLIGRGIDPRSSQLDWEGARGEMKVQAEKDVRATMLLDQIAAQEEITVSDEEIEAEIDAVSAASRQPKEQVRAALTKDGGERSIAHRLRNRKALDLLIENARIEEEAWSEENQESVTP